MTGQGGPAVTDEDEGRRLARREKARHRAERAKQNYKPFKQRLRRPFHNCEDATECVKEVLASTLRLRWWMHITSKEREALYEWARYDLYPAVEYRETGWTIPPPPEPKVPENSQVRFFASSPYSLLHLAQTHQYFQCAELLRNANKTLKELPARLRAKVRLPLAPARWLIRRLPPSFCPGRVGRSYSE